MKWWMVVVVGSVGCVKPEEPTETGSDPTPPPTDTETEAPPASSVTVDPPSIELGTVFVGAEVTTTLTVTNTGEAAVDVAAAVAGWTVTPGATAVDPAGSVVFDLAWTPTAWGDGATTAEVSVDGVVAVTVPITLLVQEDADGDGHGSVESGGDDCDDTRADAFPGQPEVWYDGLDGACDGGDDYDQDGDGSPIPGDCNDEDPAVAPGASEVWYDGVDSDCSGGSDYDQDADGSDSPDDCDDLDPAVAPGAVEVWYDGVDGDCSGGSDWDADGDAWDAPDDCVDADPLVYPGASEVWYDGVDADCDGADDFDQDADGVAWPADCVDVDAAVFPGAPDAWYDGVDSDCDGADDYDQDADGAPIPADCVDTDPTIGPFAVEVWYDGVDADCDGADDYDRDGDGFTPPDDCDDGRGDVSPGAVDYPYDGVDSNCDGSNDFDVDGDGVEQADDCDDEDPSVGLPFPEVMDGLDNDCDGFVDDLGIAAVSAGELYGISASWMLGSPRGLSLGGDLDGDGGPELVTLTSENGLGYAWILNGSEFVGATAEANDVAFASFTVAYDYSLWSVLGPALDVVGDDNADFVVVARDQIEAFGEVWIVSGGASLSGFSFLSGASDHTTIDGDSTLDDIWWAKPFDVDADGLPDVVVASPTDARPGGSSESGSVTVFSGDTLSGSLDLGDADGWIGGESFEDELGKALAVEDVDGDGYGDVIAAAPGDDDAGTDAGAAYVVPGGATWSWAAKANVLASLKIQGVSGNRLGYDPIANPGDVDQDGINDVIVSDGDAGDEGAWLFLGGTTGTRTVASADVVFTGDDGFGTAVSVDHDFDGDGFDDVMIGAPDAGDLGAGVVYVWYARAAWPAVMEPEGSDLSITGPSSYGDFGASIVGGYDLTGDDREDVVVGAPLLDQAGTSSGTIFLIPGPA